MKKTLLSLLFLLTLTFQSANAMIILSLEPTQLGKLVVISLAGQGTAMIAEGYAEDSGHVNTAEALDVIGTMIAIGSVALSEDSESYEIALSVDEIEALGYDSAETIASELAALENTGAQITLEIADGSSYQELVNSLKIKIEDQVNISISTATAEYLLESTGV